MAEVSLEALLGKTEEQAKQEYVNGLIYSVKKKIILPLLTTGQSIEEIKSVLTDKINNLYESVITLPSYANELIRNKVVNGVGVVVNYPLGENCIELILKEIKYWAKSSITEIIVLLPLSDMKFGKYKNSEKILKKLIKLRGKKQVSVMLDTSNLTDVQLLESARKLSSYRLNKIYLSNGEFVDKTEQKVLSIFKSVKRKYDVKYVLFCKTENVGELQQYLTNCDFVACRKATSLLSETLSKVTI